MTLAMWLAFAGGAIFGGTLGVVVMSALAAKRIGEAYDRGHDDATRQASRPFSWRSTARES